MLRKVVLSFVFSALAFANVQAQDFQGIAVYESKTSTSDFKTRFEGNKDMTPDMQKMIEERKKANELTNSRDKAIAYCDKVKGQYFDVIRYHVDKLEVLVDDAYWMLPKYREILFLR